MKRICCIAAGFLLLAVPALAQFQRQFGTALDESFHKIIKSGTNYYVLGAGEVAEGQPGQATVSRLNALGELQWTRSLTIGSRWNDAVLTPSGDLLVVGQSMPDDNTSKGIMGVITATGSFAWVRSYDIPNRDGFTKVVRNPSPQNPFFSYYVLGHQLQSQPATDDVFLMNIDETGAINWKKFYFSTADDEFVNDLEALPNGDLLLAGHQSGFGVFFRADKNGVIYNGVTPSTPFNFADLASSSGGNFLAVGYNFQEEKVHLMQFNADLIILWDVTISGLTEVSQVFQATSGDIYVLGTKPNGPLLFQKVICRFTLDTDEPTLAWVKYLDNGVTATTGGTLSFFAPGQLAYADGRILASGGFGEFCSFASVSDLDLTTCMTVTTSAVVQPANQLFNGPLLPNVAFFDAPMAATLTSVLRTWQQGGACPDPHDASITGTLYLECGTQPYANQPILSGWTVRLLNSMGNIISEQATDANGDYAFLDLPAAQYTCKAAIPPGWTPKVPATGQYNINLNSSEQLVQNFGLCPACSCDSSYVNFQPIPSDGGACSYLAQINISQDFCFGSIDIELESGAFTGVEYLVGNVTGEVLNSHHIRLTQSPGSDGISNAILRIGLEQGSDVYNITVTTNSDAVVNPLTCVREFSLPCPVPNAPACCPANSTFGPELVLDGNFGPSSVITPNTNYPSSPGSIVTGTYSVLNGAQVSGIWSCVGKSGDPFNDYFLAINGDSGPAVKTVWKQPVTVTPGAQYAYSIWVNNLVIPKIPYNYLPNVQIQIVDAITNTVVASNSMMLPKVPDKWENICLLWTPTANPNNPSNQYRLEIVDLDFNAYGNDFALDCISFKECIPPPPCTCLGFQNMEFYNFLNGPNIPAYCDSTSILLPCIGPDALYWFQWTLQCSDPMCEQSVDYMIVPGGGGPALVSGSIPSGGFPFFNFSYNQLSGPGNYEIILTGHCGEDSCVCTVNFTLQTCCNCGGFSNMTWRPTQGIMNLSVACNDTLGISCDQTFEPRVSGVFQCQGTQCTSSTTIHWVLTDPSGAVIQNIPIPATPGFTIALNPGWFSQPGVYTLTLTGQCAGQNCPPCILYFDSQGCPNQPQNCCFEWADPLIGTLSSTVNDIVLDASGNTYTIGNFDGTVDFDPGPGILNIATHGATDAYIVKIDPTDNLVWARTIGGVNADNGSAITTDAQGNIYAVGNFIGTVDFDPGPGVFTMNAAVQDLFVLKLDNTGSFVWVRQIGGANTAYIQSESVALDGSGNIYLAGDFDGTVDFDPGAGVTNLTGTDMFVCKLDPLGALVWTKQFGTTAPHVQKANALALDAAGNLYTTGYFGVTVDFNPGPAVFNLTPVGAEDVFVCKLDNAGNFVTAFQVGGPLGEDSRSIAVDGLGNSYITGFSNGIADFDPSSGVFNLVSAGTSTFVAKYNTAGSLIWAKLYDGASFSVGSAIALDAQGYVYTTGVFGGTFDFDPGVGIYNLTATGIQSGFIAKLDPVGNFAWAKALNSSQIALGKAIAIDGLKNVYSAGNFRGSTDFDPGVPVFNINTASPVSAYVHKMGICPPDDCMCGGFTNMAYLSTQGNMPSPVMCGDAMSISCNQAFQPQISGQFQCLGNQCDPNPQINWELKDPGGTPFQSGQVSGPNFTVALTPSWFNAPGAYTLTLTGQCGGQPCPPCVLYLESAGCPSQTDTCCFKWVDAFVGTTSAVVAKQTAFDGQGNIYSIGDFEGTADFDPGPGVSNITPAGLSDFYISKIDPNGNLLWLRTIGSAVLERATSIVSDAQGNVYVTGIFFGTLDFDPGPGVFNMTAGGWDLFILKLDSGGNFIWAKQLGGAASNYLYSQSIVLDNAGNIYLTGDFWGTIDFDPGPGLANLTGADMFVCKLDPLGALIWVKQFVAAGPVLHGSNVMALDASGNIYIGGFFGVTTDFDPGTGVFSLTPLSPADIFICKLDNAGNFVYAHQIANALSESCLDLVTDGAGNIYTTGYFNGTLDFDPGPGVANLTTTSQGIFIAKYNPPGGLVWAKAYSTLASGTNVSMGNSLALDGQGNVYTTGTFSGGFDFDPGAAVYFLSATGMKDGFIAKLDPAGNFRSAKALHGTQETQGNAIAIDGPGNIYTAGNFLGTTDFDPGTPVFNLTSAANLGAFVHKMGACLPDSCHCGGFSNMTWRPAQGVMNLPIACGDTMGIDCNQAFEPRVGGLFQCLGSPCDPNLMVHWELKDPSGFPIQSGQVPPSNFTLALTPSWFNAPGTYTLTFTGQCGNQTCEPCILYFTSEGCGCCTDFDAFCQAVMNAVNVTVDNDSCKAIVNIGTLNDCDYIQSIDWGDNQTTNGGLVSGAMVMHNYSGSGTYYITYQAFQQDNTGNLCFFKMWTDTITLACDTACVCQSNFTISQNGVDYPVFCDPHMGFIPVLPCPAHNVTVSGFIGFVNPITGDPCEETTVHWELLKPDNSLQSGTTTNYSAFFYPKDSVDEPGTYCLTLMTVYPGTLDTCVCKVTWIQEACDSCICASDLTLLHSGMSYPVTCDPHIGFTPSFGCPVADVTVNGVFGCISGATGMSCGSTPVSWVLNGPNGTIGNGSATNQPALTFPASQISATGSYSLILTTLCPGATDSCICEVQWFQEPCDTCVMVPPGLVAWWPMDDQWGDLSAIDISGGNHHGVPKPNGFLGLGSGPDPVPGVVGDALNFKTVPVIAYLEVADHPDLNFPNGSFTIDAWINTVNMGTQSGPIVNKLSNLNGTGYYFYVSGTTSSSKVALVIGTGTPNSTVVLQGPSVVTGSWTFVAVTVTTSQATFYVKDMNTGVFQQTTVPINTTVAPYNTLPLRIGNNPLDPHWNITIDELEIFNRELDYSEIFSICNAGSFGKCKPENCLCGTLSTEVDAGYAVVNSGNQVYTFQPLGLLDDCDQVTWLWGDGSESQSMGRQVVEHFFAESTIFNVCMEVNRTETTGGSCGSSTCRDVTAVDALNLSNALRLYPNPTTGALTLEWGNTDVKNGSIQLTGPVGQTLRNWSIPHGATRMEVPLDDLPAGMYFVKLLSEDRLVAVRKVVRQ